MPFFLYVFDADAQPSLFEEVVDLEESVAICEELVAEEGYPRAEVWSMGGDRLYGVIREGGSLRTFGRPQDLELGDEDAAPARNGAAAHAPADAPAAAPAEPPPPPPLGMLGEQPERPEQWFGM